jgi:hypothetical protein
MWKAALIFSLLFVGCLRSASAAQDYTARLDAVLEKVKADLAVKKPEWIHRSIEPIMGSRNVSVNNWETDGQIVRVSIIAFGSAEEAAVAMRRFSSETRTLDRLPELGDGGYSWGFHGSNICFRKGDVTVFVSNEVTNLKEAVKLTQEFAVLIAGAIPAS